MPRAIRILLLVAALSATAVVCVGLWSKLSENFFEMTSPSLIVEQFPRGLGTAPVSAKFRIQDSGAGLDQIIVRLYQKRVKYEILKQSFSGKKEAIVTIDFKDLDSQGFVEGPTELVVKVFDKSFYSNGTEERFPLAIDKNIPVAEVLSTQHNLRAGGAQLVLYQAVDQNLVLSGVKSARLSFLGVPIRDIDPAIEHADYFGALFSYPIDQYQEQIKPRVFAEDIVGNSVQKSFYHKILPPKVRNISRTLRESLMIKALPQAIGKYLARMGKDSSIITNDAGPQFQFLFNEIKKSNALELSKQMAVLRERYFMTPFLRPPGTVVEGFGNRVKYYYRKDMLLERVADGFRIAMDPDGAVIAANDGVVAFSEANEFYGRVVGIDHGMGLYSIYGNLEQTLVSPGEKVTQSQTIGTIGATAFALPNELIFEMRLQGFPVDPVEWWEKGWFFSHIEGKLNEVKRQLGLPINRLDFR